MPYRSTSDLPDSVKSNLPSHAQSIYLSAFNNAAKDNDEESAHRIAWSAVKNQYKKDGDSWEKKEEDKKSALWWGTSSHTARQSAPNYRGPGVYSEERQWWGDPLVNTPSWWKEAIGQEDLYRPQGTPDDHPLKTHEMDPQEPASGPDLRVGDEVTTYDGRTGTIDETLDVDTYSVRLDDGTVDNFHATQLTPDYPAADHGEPDDLMDHERFMGADPEGQDFEDPTFTYSPGEWLDDQVQSLKEGDVVHVYNPYDANGSFLDEEGAVTRAEGNSYEVDLPSGTGHFAREELELLEDDNPQYKEPPGPSVSSSWWKRAAPPVQTLERTDTPPSAPSSPFKLDWNSLDEGSTSVNAVPWYGDMNRYTEEDAANKNSPAQKDWVGRPKIPGKPSVGIPELIRRGLLSQEGSGKDKSYDVTPMAENVFAAYKWGSPDQKEGGATWYDEAQAEAQQVVNTYQPLVGADKLDLDKVIGIIAAVSPNLSWEKNMLYPPLIVRQYLVEGITDPTQWREDDVALTGSSKGQRKKMAIMNSNREKVIAIFNGEHIDDLTDAAKTRNFFHNISGNSDRVTVDVWAMRICMGELKPLSNVIDPWTGERITYGGPSPTVYPLMADAYRMAADWINQEEGEGTTTPRDLQAITWNVYRDLGVNAGIDLSEPPDENLIPEEELQRQMDEAGYKPPGEPEAQDPWWKENPRGAAPTPPGQNNNAPSFAFSSLSWWYGSAR